jgi:hypothetical protein
MESNGFGGLLFRRLVASNGVSSSASIRIKRRPTAWSSRFRAYKVAIDGEVLGELRRGEEQVFEVRPGHHEVQLRIDWTRSQPVEVDLVAGSEATLTCGGRNPLLALYWITAGRNRYPVLERPTSADTSG